MISQELLEKMSSVIENTFKNKYLNDSIGYSYEKQDAINALDDLKNENNDDLLNLVLDDIEINLDVEVNDFDDDDWDNFYNILDSEIDNAKESIIDIEVEDEFSNAYWEE
ncbi:MAG: hypothetical protein J6D03_00585 [Clostridia bacterium]|nr:hypothetical protein [Clostridia bacterium]